MLRNEGNGRKRWSSLLFAARFGCERASFRAAVEYAVFIRSASNDKKAYLSEFQSE